MFQNLLPKMIKIWPETIVELLRRMPASGTCDLPVQSCDHQEVSCDLSADIYLMLARRARSSGLLAEHVEDEENWCGVLRKDLIVSSLHSSISQV